MGNKCFQTAMGFAIVMTAILFIGSCATIPSRNTDRISSDRMQDVKYSIQEAVEYLSQDLLRQLEEHGSQPIAMGFFRKEDKTRNALCKILEIQLSSDLKCPRPVDTYENLDKYRKFMKDIDSNVTEYDHGLAYAHYLITGDLILMRNAELINIVVSGFDVQKGDPILTAKCSLSFKDKDVREKWGDKSELMIYTGMYVESGNKMIEAPTSGNIQMQSGQGFQIYVDPIEPVYVYIANFDSSGKGYSLFPNNCDNGFWKNPIPSGGKFWFPKKGLYVLDNEVGNEEIYIFTSREKNPAIESLISQLNDVCGKKEISAKRNDTEIRSALDEYIEKGVGYKEIYDKPVLHDNHQSHIEDIRARLLSSEGDMINRRIIIDHQ